MSSTPRFKIIGLVGGLGALALAAGFFFLSQGQPSSSAATSHTVIPLSKRVHTTVKKHALKRIVRKPAVAKPKPAVIKPKTKPVVTPPAANGLPAALTAALANNRVVVVSLYAPNLQLDDMALREARAGAAQAGFGFVALNVLNERQSRQLTKQLGVLEDPSVLIYRRPSELVSRFSGFVDKQTVAQAARNAGL